MTDEITDQTLDRVAALWKQADDLIEESNLMANEAKNKAFLAEEKEDEAETLWRPIADAHPEWFDALRDGKDPRT